MTAPRLTALAALDMNEPASGNLRRLFPRRDLLHLDPFARCEELFAEPPAGLPPHEHRGFEAVTLVLKGALEHTEVSLGQVLARSGDVLRLTAGRGCFHAERFPEPGQTHLLQIWVALARADKDRPPELQHVAADSLPVTRPKGLVRREVVGPRGPVTLSTAAGIVDLAFSGRRTAHEEPLPEGHVGFLVVTHGEVRASGHALGPGSALLFSDALSLTLEGRKGARCVLVHGQPRREPIRPWGTVVD